MAAKKIKPALKNNKPALTKNKTAAKKESAPKKNETAKEVKTVQQVTTEFNHNEIEKALFDRAKGYEYCETVTEPGENGEEEKILKKTKKKAIPDVTACIFWLKNRLPDKWKDPKEIEEEKQTMKDFLEHYYDED